MEELNKKTVRKFNNYFLNLLNELNNLYPHLKSTTKYYNKLMENLDNETLLLLFKKKITPYLDLLNQNDIEIITKPIFKNINLTSLEISESTKITILKYFNILYIQSFRYNKSLEDINSLLRTKQHKTVEEKSFLVSIQNLKSKNLALQSNTQETETDESDNTSMPSLGGMDPSKLMNGSIGKLAMDIAKDIDIQKLNLNDPTKLLTSMLSGNMEDNGIQSLFSSITTKINDKINSGELDTNNILSEAQNIMGGAGSGSSMPNIPGMPNLGNMSGMLSGIQKMMGQMAPTQSNESQSESMNTNNETSPNLPNVDENMLKDVLTSEDFQQKMKAELEKTGELLQSIQQFNNNQPQEAEQLNSIDNTDNTQMMNNVESDVQDIKQNLLKTLNKTQRKFLKRKLKKLTKSKKR